MLKEALEAHLQWMYDDGDVLPDPHDSVTIDMSEDCEYPNPPGYYVVIEQLSIAMPTAKQTGAVKPSSRELTAA